MITIVDISTVAHRWAAQECEHSRTKNNSFSFRGPLLYSYTTCIGAIHNGMPLLTSIVYTKTTSSKHMPHARRWTQYQAIEVPYPADPHEPRNMAHLVHNYDRAIVTLRHMRPNRQPHEFELEAPRKAADELAKFCDHFGIGYVPRKWFADVAEARAYHALMVERWNEPAAVARRLRAKAKRMLEELVHG